MLRYLAGEPIYPLGYVRHKIPMNKSKNEQLETVDEIKVKLLRQSLYGRSIEYAGNRISLYAAQKGTCALTSEKFTSTEEILNAVCGENRTHGVKWGKRRRLPQSLTYHYN